MDRNRLGRRLDDKPYRLRGRNGRAACRTASGGSLGHGRELRAESRHRRRPLIRDEDVALIGYRAFGDNDHSLSEHVRDTAIAIVDLPELRELGIRRAVIMFRSILQTPRVAGLDVTIFNPRLDPNRALAALLAVGLASMPPAFSKNVL